MLENMDLEVIHSPSWGYGSEDDELDTAGREAKEWDKNLDKKDKKLMLKA